MPGSAIGWACQGPGVAAKARRGLVSGDHAAGLEQLEEWGEVVEAAAFAITPTWCAVGSGEFSWWPVLGGPAAAGLVSRGDRPARSALAQDSKVVAQIHSRRSDP